jgi:hypothetical protein
MIGLARFIKGSVSVKELMELPNGFSHTVFKQYFESTKTKEGQEALGAAEMEDEIEDIIGG